MKSKNKKYDVVLIGAEQDIIFELNRSKHRILGYFGKKKNDCKIKYLGTFNKIEKYLNAHINSRLCISMGPTNRRKLFLNRFRKKIFTYVSNKSIVSKDIKIGLGSFIQAFCFIGNNVLIDSCCKINIRSSIHHDCKIGSCTDIAPSVTILGNVGIGQECYIGSGTVIREKIQIKNKVMTGIKSAVVSNIKSEGVYVGVPAKKIKNNYKRP
ncbi:hypothetical protein N9T21_03840 [Candidatus Pelagibacter sp.]|nr:hypothetical protein [Candidatus Pelagibacter sp.]